VSAPRPILQAFGNRRIAAMLLLGFASGLPLALSAGTLQAWLTVEGLDIRTIGFFALAGLPYTFKFVWAPLADRFEPPLVGRRRSWLVVTQLGLAALCFVMATLDPKASVMAVGACAVAIAFLSASQDIVFDAARRGCRGVGARLPAGDAGVGRARADPGRPVARLARHVPRDGCTVRRDGRGEPVGTAHAAGAAVEERRAARAGRFRRNGRFVSLGADTLMLLAACFAALQAARRAGFPSFLAPWDAFFSRERAAALLAMIVLYKLGDAFAGSLSTTFLIRGAGFTATEVGAVNKVLGLAATIVGALVGGAWLARRPLYGSLMLFGLLQAVSNFGYWLLSVLPKDYALMAAAIGLENLCGGMGTAAFVAFLMALTDRRFSAAQYALLSALAAVGRVYVGPASGVLVEAFGWPTFFVFTVGAALPGLVLLRWLRPQVMALDPPRDARAGGGLQSR